MSDHISVEELADAAVGLLAPARAEVVRTHLDSCPTCRQTAELLAGVTTTLAAEPLPTMPARVVARLDAVIADEHARRQGDSQPSDDLGAGGRPTAGVLAWAPRSRLAAPASPDLHYGRSAGWILAAAAAAALVGFGGYVVSARAGLNEPPSGAAAVSSGKLGVQAGQLEREGDVDPHRFSRAWSCARQVTDGRITGIVSVTVDGAPALLVYLRAGDGQRVAVVEGCDIDAPRVTATTQLTR